MDANETCPLEDLVRWNSGLSALIKSARSFESTSIVVLRPDHAVAATEKVIDGRASPDQLVNWAQAVHFAEQVHVEEAHQDLLTKFLFEISTPELFEPVTREVCQRWLRVLQTSMVSDPAATER